MSQCQLVVSWYISQIAGSRPLTERKPNAPTASQEQFIQGAPVLHVQDVKKTHGAVHLPNLVEK